MTQTNSMTNTAVDATNTSVIDITTNGVEMNIVASKSDPNTIPAGLGGTIHNQPFWNDTIVAAIGGAFLTWSLPNGTTAYQLVGDV